MLQFVFLSNKFYQHYSMCPEIEQKQNRPYIQVQVIVDGVLFGVPLRSNIKHQNVLWTDKSNHCGADFSKSVVIADPDGYIDTVIHNSVTMRSSSIFSPTLTLHALGRNGFDTEKIRYNVAVTIKTPKYEGSLYDAILQTYQNLTPIEIRNISRLTV